MTDLFALLAAAPAEPAGLLDRLWASVDEPWEAALFFFGLIAQTMFFGRWIVQWGATERRGESHMPIAFWWMSLAGATMLLVYFTLRAELIGMLGQSIGWAVYSRNLWLIRKGATSP